MPALSDTITTPTGKPGKTIDTTVDALWHVTKFDQDNLLASNEKPAFAAFSKAPSKTEVVEQRNEFLRPDGTRGYFSQYRLVDATDKVWEKSLSTENGPEFAKDWVEVEEE